MVQKIKGFGVSVDSGDINGECKCAQCGYKNKFVIKGYKKSEK